MIIRRILSAWPLVALMPPLLLLGACQTPAEPQTWYDEYKNERGLFVHASRQSGGYALRFATNEADPEHVQVRVQATRSPIRGGTAYFLVDGERYEMPMQVQSYRQAARPARTRSSVHAGRGIGSGFHTGVGFTLGASPQPDVHHAWIDLPRKFVRTLANANEARLRAGESPGPEFTLSERTRERLVDLLEWQQDQTFSD